MNHLAEMTARREYIIVRYGPDQKAQISELTRLRATLEEVARKVQSAVVSGQRSETGKGGVKPRPTLRVWLRQPRDPYRVPACISLS